MSLAWYINRLRAMGPGELVHRVGEKVKKVRARGRLEGWARYPGAEILPLPGLRERVLAAPDTIRNDIRLAAKTVLAGRFAALGVGWPERRAGELFPASLWALDPVTGGSWPGAGQYCFDISYRHERTLGDIKYVWELNRLQFLQPLAAHALLSGDAGSLAAVEAAVASWHAANPPFRGLGWNSGIELALRAISLLVVTSLVGEKLSAETNARIAATLHATAVWLRRYPSRFSSANNHLIAELAGEYLIGTAMPGLPFAAAMAANARRKLTTEVTRQILADGVPAEQSPSYGAFSAEFLLLSATVARDAGAPFPDAVADRLGAFAEFIGWIALENGTVPAIGDDDEGRVLTLGTHESAYPGSVANAIAGFLGQGAPTDAAADFRGVLLGRSSTRAPSPTGCRVFAAGGYSVVNEAIGGRNFSLVFDHGPLGYLSIAAHGHADALALTLAVDGKPVLVDPGTYLYHSGGAARDWFRGTKAHNTLSLDGADQSIISGAFNWSHKAKSRLDRRITVPRWSFAASHDGFRGRFGVVHQRELNRTATGLTITDRLIGAGEGRDATLSFQLAPDLSAHIDGRDVIIRRGEVTVLTLGFAAGKLGLERGGENLDGGWVSPAFGIKQPATRIVWQGRVSEMGQVIDVRVDDAATVSRFVHQLEAV